MKGAAKFTGGADRRSAQGADGGQNGAPGYVIINPGTDREQRYDTMVSNLDLKPGDVVRIEAPGGGGVGDPRERDRERVLGDLEDGLISPQAAREVYGLSEEELRKLGAQRSLT